MYAVIRTGGKQYRVQEGDILRVEKLDTEAGKKVTFDDVLLVGEGESIKAGAAAAKAKVTAVVTESGRGQKVVVFKKRRRKNYRLTQGHRQDYTQVKITGVSAGAAKKAAAKTEEKPAAKKAAVKKSEAKPAAKKVAPKKATAKAAAKPAAKKAPAKAKATKADKE